MWGNLFTFLGEQYGNIASVLGLALTLYTLWRVQQEGRATRQVARAAVEKVALQLTYNKIGEGLRLVRELTDACRQRRWPRALDRCEEARLALAELATGAFLTEGEQVTLGRAVDQLRLLLEYLEKAAPRTGTGQLPDPRRRQLQDLLAQLSGLQGRFHNRMLQVEP